MQKSLILSVITYMTIPAFAGIVLFNGENNSKITYATRNIKSLTINADENAQLIPSLKETVNISIKFDYEDFMYSKSRSSDEDIDQYRKDKFEAGKKYHTEKNYELLSKLDTSDLKNLYVSKYMPFFSFECTSDKLNDLYKTTLKSFESKSYIQNINISRGEKEIKPSLYDVKNDWGITPILNNTYHLTGSGIKVGILESGIADINNAGIQNRITTFNDYWFETVTNHATSMANVIGGTYGVAPNCTMYSAQFTGFDCIAEFDWFLDNDVHIVNMSYGENNPTGVYNNESAYIDSLVNTYGITCIAAAGNEGQASGYVSNPALGYNVLGVGECANNGSAYTFASSYKEVEGPDKPNIMAPGTFTLRQAQSGSGTSMASAYTSGVAALLMEGYEDFKLFPERLFSVLCATNKSLNENASTSYEGMRDRTGVGGSVSPVDAFINVLNEEHLFFTTSGNDGELINLPMERGDRLKACAFWRAYSNGLADGTAHTDYDLVLFDEYLNRVSESRFGRDNYEYIEYVVPTDGWYQLEFYFALNHAQSIENYCVAWMIEHPEN